MKDYFENLLDQLSKRSVDVVKKDILIEIKAAAIP